MEPRARIPVLSYAEGKRVCLNITNRCTLHCRFCPKFQGQWVVNGHDLRLEHDPTPAELLASVGDPARYSEVVFSGLGEPTLRLYEALETAHALRRQGVRTRMITDGLANLVHGRDVTPDFENIIDSIAISLNAHDQTTYTDHCPSQVPGTYESMREFANRIRYFVPDVVLTCVEGLPGVDYAACKRIADGLGVDFQLRKAEAFE